MDEPTHEYRAARTILALGFGAAAVFYAMTNGHPDPFVFGGLLLAAAGMVAAKIEDFRR